MPDRQDGSLETPSRFWEKLGREHAEDLDAFGLENVKRRQALRYFTWRWGAASLRRSEQLRFLLRNTPARSLLRALLAPHAPRSSWSGVGWSTLDTWLYERAIALLWEYASAHGDRQVMDLPEPALGNPLPVRYRGRLISQDLANSSLEVAAVRRGVGRRRVRSILEVGAGYGRTAYALLNVYPEASYTVVDIEPALSISRWYLASVFPDRDIRHLPPDRVGEIPSGSVDLAVSISSLQEMTVDQVARYIELFDRVAAGGSVFLKQWERWENPDDGVVLEFEKYPIPERWHAVYVEQSPVQTNFRQATWSVPS